MQGPRQRAQGPGHHLQAPAHRRLSPGARPGRPSRPAARVWRAWYAAGAGDPPGRYASPCGVRRVRASRQTGAPRCAVTGLRRARGPCARAAHGPRRRGVRARVEALAAAGQARRTDRVARRRLARLLAVAVLVGVLVVARRRRRGRRGRLGRRALLLLLLGLLLLAALLALGLFGGLALDQLLRHALCARARGSGLPSGSFRAVCGRRDGPQLHRRSGAPCRLA